MGAIPLLVLTGANVWTDSSLDYPKGASTVAGLFAKVAGESGGPYDESKIIELVSSYGDHVEIFQDGPKVWVKASQTEFAQHVPANPRTPERSNVASTTAENEAPSKAPRILFLGVGVILFAVIGWVGFTSSSNRTNESPPKATQSDTVTPAPVEKAPAPEWTPADRLRDSTSLTEALGVLRPIFKDTTNEPDPAAYLLALWGTSHLDWKAIVGLGETTHSKVMKDPEAERGKRICTSGSIVEIAVDRSAKTPLYAGGLITAAMNVYRFIALRSTGELVARSPARFCGIVTGRESYSNSGGGVTHAVKVVGMFDLPENRK
jgi:hypothetical protein